MFRWYYPIFLRFALALVATFSFEGFAANTAPIIQPHSNQVVTAWGMMGFAPHVRDNETNIITWSIVDAPPRYDNQFEFASHKWTRQLRLVDLDAFARHSSNSSYNKFVFFASHR
jgi:hypothetical protein